MYFEYNASALGAGGVIERGPVSYTIPSLASIALAPTGGEGRTVVSNYYSQELSFSHAETRVSGRESVDPAGERSFTTWTYVLLKNVNIFDVVKVGEMGSTVTSTRGFKGGDDHPFELSIWYQDVVIDGKAARPRIDLRLTGFARYDDLVKAVTAPKRTAADTQQLADSFNATPDELARLVRERKPVQCSMVEQVEGLPPQGKGRGVVIPGLGTAYFGELVLKPGRRRLNLLRMKFGLRGQQEGPFDEGLGPGPTGGSMTLGSGEGNGTPIEP